MAVFLRNKTILQRAALALALLGLLAGLAPGQSRSRRKPRGPRALAVVEWPASGPPRLVPITILVEGRYYDAGIYKASPIPMALEPDTVYEVTQTGESIGLFVITGAREAKELWYAEGHFQPNAPAAAEKAAPSTLTVTARDEDAPPRLRHPGEKSSAPAKSEPPATPAPAPAPPPPRQEDSDRPILRRGKPGGAAQAASLPGSVEVPKGAAAITETARGEVIKPGSPAAVITRVLPAISDAGPSEHRSYKFDWRPEEQQRLTRAIEALATSALEKYARAHPGNRPGKLEAVQVRAFDLDLSNEPEVVLTARAPEAPAPPAQARRGKAGGQSATPAPPGAKALTYFVTVAARVDLSGELWPLLTSATDSEHLDVVPRMTLLDAVDADGDGRGDLLFRETSDQGRSFGLYRVDPGRLTKLFSGPVEP